MERVGESRPEAPGATDLGGSSNYPSNILGVRSGVGFLGNSTCPRVSRSLAPGENLDRLHRHPRVRRRPCPHGRGGPGQPGGSRGCTRGRKGSGLIFPRHLSTAIGVTLNSSLVTPSGHLKGIISSPDPGTIKEPALNPARLATGVASWGEPGDLCPVWVRLRSPRKARGLGEAA